MTSPVDYFQALQKQRADALTRFGFTTRQSEFLALVMVHSGVCVQRQYCQFGDIAYGQAVHDFFRRLTDDKWATAYPCGRRGSHILHIQHKTLYRAIGEADNRNRRPPAAARAIERLMLLDAVLAERDITWLGTERDKVDYCVSHRGLEPTHLPSVAFTSAGGRTVRRFAEKLPIGITPEGRVTFLYVVNDPTALAFRDFIERHRMLLRRLLPWRVLIALPRSLRATERDHRAVIHELFAPPVRPAVVDEFLWYCQTRQLVEQVPGAAPGLDAARFQRARRAFGAPRFFAAYRGWKQHGDATLHHLLSPTLHDAASRGDARVETHVLPHAYLHLDAIVQTA